MTLIYPDSNVLVYHFEGHPVFGTKAQAIIAHALSPNCRIVSTTVAWGELLVKPVLERNDFQISRLRSFFHSEAVLMVPYTAKAALTFAGLRATERIAPLDAIHLACAAAAGVDFFITNDLRLQKLTIPGIGRIAGLDVEF